MSENERVPAKEKLRAVVDQVYQNAWDAKKRGEPIGWSSSKFPAEIAETLGLAVCYPENQAAAISAKHGGQRMCEHAESMGYDADEKPMPQPDFVLCCNNI